MFPRSEDGTCSLGFPAVLHYLPLARDWAGTVAMIQDQTLDEIADMRLVVDELCTMAVSMAVPPCVVRCSWRAEPGCVELTVSVRSRLDSPSFEYPLSWQIVQTLAESVESEVLPPVDDGGPVVVTITALVPRPVH